ncbi:hypothetical protein LTR22_000511 [Elasticomyces elasticus]|nr:hypothetical protein LTR22_000511 [Elasticomyces elasticus]KAK4931976.1 hypothetical protein LTR49_001663 [Elasticomyces elasticus]KAK5768492.1 hypothetical protein LTS12_001280 [Elasticomyces elasticus]
MTPTLVLLALAIASASADISLELFSSTDCSGPSVLDAHPLPNADPKASPPSGCQTTNSFQSFKPISLDSNFFCTLHQDAACDSQQISANVDADNGSGGLDVCIGTVPSQSILCFAGPVGNVFVGQTQTTVDSFPPGIVDAAINASCVGGRTCDPTNIFKAPFPHFNLPSSCEETITVDGTFTSQADQDTLRQVLLQAVGASIISTSTDTTGSAEDDQTIITTPAFFKATLGDASNPTRASLQVTIGLSAECNKPDDPFSCGGDLISSINALLGAVPVAGGAAVLAFTAACQVATH